MASQRAEAELREKVGQNIEQSEAQQTTLADYSWLTQVPFLPWKLPDINPHTKLSLLSLLIAD